jgi:hypothetical protein
MCDDEYCPDPPGLAMRRKLLESRDRPKDIFSAHAKLFKQEHGYTGLQRALTQSAERQRQLRMKRNLVSNTPVPGNAITSDEVHLRAALARVEGVFPESEPSTSEERRPST